MKKIFISGFIAGVILFVFSYGSIYIAIRWFPAFFSNYNNPLFNSDGSRDLLFYAHAFVISFSLSWFWERFKSLLIGPFVLRGLEFGLVYGITAMIPVMWITFSSLDITLTMVFSWLIYGLVQSSIAGIVFAKLNP